jgi:cell division protein YceG involved in septum cleavage
MEINSKTKIKKRFLFLSKHSNFFLFLLFIILTALAGFIFYQKVYLLLTTADQNNPINSQIKRITIKNNLLEKISERLDKKNFYISEETEKEFSDPFEP